MNMNVTARRKDEFLDALNKAGGQSGNKSLRLALNWDEVFYWKIQQALVADGRIRSGRGKGGSVHIAQDALAPTSGESSIPTDEEVSVNNSPIRERDLYQPIKGELEKKWVSSHGYDSWIIEETQPFRMLQRR
jgi:hypothetical protein